MTNPIAAHALFDPPYTPAAAGFPPDLLSGVGAQEIAEAPEQMRDRHLQVPRNVGVLPPH